MLAFGATGKFYAQIQDGAPFEVLLAADDETPAKLEREGLAVPGSRFTYATGRLVLWSADAGHRRRARARCCGSRHAASWRSRTRAWRPYGAAAVETLTRLGVLAAWQPQLVQGENIGQAYQFVATGNAALGFVALSQVMADGRISKARLDRARATARAAQAGRGDARPAAPPIRPRRRSWIT